MTHNLVQRVTTFCAQNSIFDNQSTLLIACSGGVDSAVLLHFFSKLCPERSIIVHLNHQWWPSDEEAEKLVLARAKHYALPVHVAKASDFSATTSKGSREEHARRIRHAFFKQVAQQYQNPVVLFGHHADDNVETLLLRLARGTTLAGASGIMPRSGMFGHPLLCLRKFEIQQYAQEFRLAFIDDTANADQRHLRVRLRSSIVPLLQQIEPRFVERCLASMNRFAQAEQFVQGHIQPLYGQAVQLKDGTLYLNVGLFRTYEPFVRKRIILQWLVESNVLFDPHEAFLDEIDRFFMHVQQSKSHHITPQFSINVIACFAYCSIK